MPAKNILSLKDDFEIFVFDIYGVIWDGRNPIVGYAEVMQKLLACGKQVVIMSNGTILSNQAEVSLAKRGFKKGIHYTRVVTSGDVAEADFAQDVQKLKFYQFGRPNDVLFKRSQYVELDKPEEADFIYAGVPQRFENEMWRDYLTMDVFAEEIEYLVSLNKPLICVNPDKKAFENQYDEPVVRQGSVAEMYQKLGGKVKYYGKPYNNIYDFAFAHDMILRDKMLMIGDTLETDIKGGHDYGMKTALTQTGIAVQNMKDTGENDLMRYVRRVGVVPDYII